jgi:hypothetical protein
MSLNVKNTASFDLEYNGWIINSTSSFLLVTMFLV